FELVAPAGTTVDYFLVEYIAGDQLQHTGNKNGFRYVTREGLNHFVSSKRRGGRYLFLTLRGMTAPVKIRTVQVEQATYPVERRGSFRCNDAALNRIWEISELTLQLCMEDTYTDCPLYEQTLWVGDARNESLYNAICFGADDLTLRCLRLCAQSLDVLPIVGAQLPSGWEVLLPAWSFLWGINVWEYYFSSGDRAGLAELYPAVLQNLRTSRTFCTDRGLFSLEGWNLFDWAPIDDKHPTVLHNSLFLVGALDAALHCCRELGEGDEAWLQAFRTELMAAILASWDPARSSYPDSYHADGTASPSISQHTSALGLLYDVLPQGSREIALRQLIDPPEGMVRVGSPFALQYFLEALEKEGQAAQALGLVRTLWQDMLDSGATTCWETFRNAFGTSPFPTRSHCHAWSSAPIYVLNRLIVGILPAAPGAAEVVVSPHPLGLSWAEGTCASPRGDLRVAWRLDGDTLHLTVAMPVDVRWRVEPNADWRGVTRVVVNEEECPELGGNL
ncbi:MAG TPA: alpha-L-rhamnosidase C-terminal domain-containing protein, partial [Armatimonadota bacterium]